jgi:hypothetical protein
MARLTQERAADPAAFHTRNPRIAASIARGEVPRGVGGFPRGPLVYQFIPTVGLKIPTVRPRPR